MHQYDDAEAAIAEALPILPSAHFFMLARRSIELYRTGETAPLRSALRQVPSGFDPGGAVTTIALRVSLMDRDFDEAERVLTGCADEKLEDNGLSGIAGALDGYTVPKTWYAGLIARGRSDETAARAEFEEAKQMVKSRLNDSPEDAKTTAMLARIHAALGNNEDALRQARRAEELLPIAKDSFDGPIIATTVAAVSAQIGENDLAIEQLQRLVGIPNGPTPGLLRAEPEWDPLRDDSRFKALMERAS